MKVIIKYEEGFGDLVITCTKVLRGIKDLRPLFSAGSLVGILIDGCKYVFEDPNKQFRTFTVLDD